jgi:hypothetical protein
MSSPGRAFSKLSLGPEVCLKRPLAASNQQSALSNQLKTKKSKSRSHPSGGFFVASGQQSAVSNQ